MPNLEDMHSDSPLDMSDDDFANMSIPDFGSEESSDDPGSVENGGDPEDSSTDMDDETTEATEETSEEESDTTDDDDADDDSETEEDIDASDTEEEETDSEESDTGAEDSSDESEGEEDASELDYKSEYEKLLAPFRANGKDVKVDSVDEAIALMQMGANYNKKMAALKPNLRLMKMLENHELLDEQKLSFLIDLDKGNPEAINKYLKDHNIDPMDLDLDKDPGYKERTYTPSDKELALDETLDSLQDTDSYSRTLDIVGNKWDAASKRVLTDNPNLIRMINDHVGNGIYDLVNTQVEKERMLGRLEGLSDFEAYKVVGDAINARGGFSQLDQSGSKPAPGQTVVTTSSARRKTTDEQRNQKRKAASSTKSKASKTTQTTFNPLSMSDEEFEKLNPKFT